jgi:hypothetical protein
MEAENIYTFLFMLNHFEESDKISISKIFYNHRKDIENRVRISVIVPLTDTIRNLMDKK